MTAQNRRVVKRQVLKGTIGGKTVFATHIGDSKIPWDKNTPVIESFVNDSSFYGRRSPSQSMSNPQPGQLNTPIPDKDDSAVPIMDDESNLKQTYKEQADIGSIISALTSGLIKLKAEVEKRQKASSNSKAGQRNAAKLAAESSGMYSYLDEVSGEDETGTINADGSIDTGESQTIMTLGADGEITEQRSPEKLETNRAPIKDNAAPQQFGTLKNDALRDALESAGIKEGESITTKENDMADEDIRGNELIQTSGGLICRKDLQGFGEALANVRSGKLKAVAMRKFYKNEDGTPKYPNVVGGAQ